jgi:hypothetical protein
LTAASISGLNLNFIQFRTGEVLVRKDWAQATALPVGLACFKGVAVSVQGYDGLLLLLKKISVSAIIVLPQDSKAWAH